MAKRKVKTDFLGKGALVQLVGVLVILYSWGDDYAVLGFGLLVGVVLLLVGSNMSQYYICSDCGNKLDGSHVKMCPTCKEAIGNKVS